MMTEMMEMKMQKIIIVIMNNKHACTRTYLLHLGWLLYCYYCASPLLCHLINRCRMRRRWHHLIVRCQASSSSRSNQAPQPTHWSTILSKSRHRTLAIGSTSHSVKTRSTDRIQSWIRVLPMHYRDSARVAQVWMTGMRAISILSFDQLMRSIWTAK